MFTSPLPDVEIPEVSIYEYLFGIARPTTTWGASR